MQRRFWNWKDDDLTIDISQWLIGLIDSGRFRGFDAVLGNTMELVLNHETSGAIRVDKSGNLVGKFGVLATKQGVITQEYDAVTLPVPTTPAGFYRKGIVVFTHEYVEIDGGQEGIYSLIMTDETAIGTGVAFPSLPNEPLQTILGYLTIPQNCTSLNDPAVLYEQADAPSFANQADFIEKSNGFFLTTLDARNNKIENLMTCTEPLDATNKFYVDKSIAENIVHATESQRGIAELATAAEAEAFTDDQRIITPLKWFRAWLKVIANQSESNGDVIDNKAITPKTLANRTATETRKGIARIATELEAKAGEDDTTIITPYKLKKAMPLTPVVVPIPDWDIQSSATAVVLHQLGLDWDKVVALDLSIRDDANGTITKGSTTANNFSLDEFGVTLVLDTTNLDLSDYNATGFVRGYITLWLKLDIPAVVAYLDVNAGVDQTVIAAQISYGTPVLKKVTKRSGNYPTSLLAIGATVEMGQNTLFSDFKIQYQKANGDWVDLGDANELSVIGSSSRNVKGTIIDTTAPMTGAYPIRAKVTNLGSVLYSNIIAIDGTQPQWTVWEDLVSTSTIVYAGVNLSGYADALGSPVTSTLWSIVSSPAGSVPVLGSPTSLNSTLKVDKFGVYELMLTCTNAEAISSSDNVVITFNQSANSNPVISNVLTAAATKDLSNTTTPVPLGGWYESSCTIVASDPDGDPLSYQLVEVDMYDPISGTIGNPVPNSDVNITQTAAGNTFNIKDMRLPSTNNVIITIEGNRIYYFKAIVSDGRGGIATAGYAVTVYKSSAPAPFSLSFSQDGNLDSRYYEGSVLLNSILDVTSLKLTLSGPSSARVQIGSSLYFGGTTLITQHLANSIPINFFVGSGSNGTATATFKAYNGAGALLGQGTIEVSGTGIIAP